MTIPLTMKPLDHYDVGTVVQPNSKDYMTTYFYDKGQLVATIPAKTSLDKILNDADIKIPTTAVKQQVLNKEEYDEAMQVYKKKLHILTKEFSADLFKEFEIENHPKKDKCFTLAYKMGYTGGLYKIYEYFELLVQLIKD